MGFIRYIKEEMQIIEERDPAIKTPLEVFLYPSFKAIIRYRIAHKLYLKKHYFLARWYSQGVTLGGTGKECGKRHPTIGNNVMISAGAKILGSFTVGENSKIGAGSVVLSEVPPNSTVVGVPGRVVKRDNVKIPREDMDQIHLPDPVFNDISRLQTDNVKLMEEVQKLSKRVKMLEQKLNNK